MAFDPTLINFLTIGNFATNPIYGIPLSQQLVAGANTGLTYLNAGGGSTYTASTTGNLANIMTLQNTDSFGIVISVPQLEGGLITRHFTGGSSISITNGDGQAGNPTISVNPSTSLQLTQIKVNGSNAGAPHSSFNLVAGSNVGLTYVDTGTQTDLTISAAVSGAASDANYYVVTQAAPDLPNSTNLGSLTSGLLKQTVTSGSVALAIATPNVDYQAANAYLTEIATLTPTNGSLLYYYGGTWITLNPSVNPGWVLATQNSTTLTWTAAGSGDVSQLGNNVFTGTNTFNTNLPTSTVTPTTSTQLITKAYGDATYATISGEVTAGGNNTFTGTNIFNTNAVTFGVAPVMSGASIAAATIPVASVVGTAASLSGANVFTGTSTFNTNLPTSTETPTTSTQLITKAYGDATYGTIAGGVTAAGNNTFTGTNIFNTNAVTFGVAPVLSGASITSATIPVASVVGTAAALSGTNAFTGTNTFNTSLPTSTVTPTTSTQLITKAFADATYATVVGEVTLAGPNAFTGNNSFNTALPTSTVTPTTSTQLITKTYGDTTYGSLGAIQTWTAVNTFTPQAVFTNSIKIPLGAVSNYVFTSDASGNGTWSAPAGGGLKTATVATSSTSATTLLSVPVPTNGVVTIAGTINASTTSTYADATGGSFNATVVSVSGTLTLIGTPIVFVNAQTTGTFNVVISGTNLLVQVTAPSATGYSWFTTYTLQSN